MRGRHAPSGRYPLSVGDAEAALEDFVKCLRENYVANERDVISAVQES